MKGWYQAAAKRGPPPARATLERITAEQTELYSRVPSPGENIPVTVEPALIDDLVPTEDEIKAAVKKNCSETGRGGHHGSAWSTSRGGSRRQRGGGVSEEKGKEKTATEEEGEDLWGKVVELIQTAFRDGTLTEEATWQTVVLVPKWKGEFQGIRLVEVIYSSPPAHDGNKTP